MGQIFTYPYPRYEPQFYTKAKLYKPKSHNPQTEAWLMGLETTPDFSGRGVDVSLQYRLRSGSINIPSSFRFCLCGGILESKGRGYRYGAIVSKRRCRSCGKSVKVAV